MTISINAWPAFVPLPDDTNCTPMPVAVNDPVGGSAIDICIVDRFGATPTWAAWFSAGTTVAGLNTYQVLLRAPGMWGIAVRDHGTGTLIGYSNGGVNSLFGHARGWMGQSLCSQMADVDDGAVTTSLYTAMWRNGSFSTPIGNGLKTYLNELFEATGIPQCALMGGAGGVGVTFDSYLAMIPNGASAYWLNASTNPWTSFAAGIAALNGRLQGVYHIAGETDSHVGANSANLYLRSLFQLDANVQALTTRKAPQLRFALCPIGYYNPALTPAADVRPILEAQHRFIALRAGAYHAGERRQLPRDSSNVHLTADGYRQFGSIIARATFREEYIL